MLEVLYHLAKFGGGSIARRASRRYLIYSEADFEVFRPVGATRCTDGDEIWHGGGDRRFIGARVILWDPKTEIFTEI